MSPAVRESSYIIRGGVEGAERLRILSRVMRPTSMVLLARAGIRRGMACLDVGCGSGDFTLDIGRTVGPCGKVVGVDLDSVKLDLARQEAEAQQVSNVEFQAIDITSDELTSTFDLVHARFLLSHLQNPLDVLVRMRSALRPGGIMVLRMSISGAIFAIHIVGPFSAMSSSIPRQREDEARTPILGRGCLRFLRTPGSRMCR